MTTDQTPAFVDPRIEPIETELRKYIVVTGQLGGRINLNLSVAGMLAIADKHDPVRAQVGELRRRIAELPDKIAEWLATEEHADFFEDHELVGFVRTCLGAVLAVPTAPTRTDEIRRAALIEAADAIQADRERGPMPVKYWAEGNRMAEHVVRALAVPTNTPAARRYDQCDDTCTADCGHCKGEGRP